MRKAQAPTTRKTTRKAPVSKILNETIPGADTPIIEHVDVAPVTQPMPEVHEENLPSRPDDELSDNVGEIGAIGFELCDLMRPDLHGVYVMNVPQVRGEYDRNGYKSAKRGSGWVTREDAFPQVTDKGELLYGDAVIMVIKLTEFNRIMAQQAARSKEAREGRGGDLRITRGAPPPPDPDPVRE